METEKRKSNGLLVLSNIVLGIALIGVLVAVVFSLFGRWGYPIELFCHFQMQYFIALAVLGGLYLLVRNWKLTLVCGIVSIVPAIKLAPMCFQKSDASRHLHAADAKTYRLMVLNVNTSSGKPGLVLEQIDSFDPDLIVLIEISTTWVHELRALEKRYPHTVLEPSSNNFGIGIYSRKRLRSGEVRLIGEARFATIFAEVELEKDRLSLIATHPLPPIGRERARLRDDQLRQLAREVPEEGTVIVCGDFNATPWSPIFREFLRSTGLRDSTVGFGWQPTWPVDNWLVRIPIDQVASSSDVYILNRRIGSPVGSDHLPVLIEFAVSRQEPSQRVDPGETTLGWSRGLKQKAANDGFMR